MHRKATILCLGHTVNYNVSQYIYIYIKKVWPRIPSTSSYAHSRLTTFEHLQNVKYTEQN